MLSTKQKKLRDSVQTLSKASVSETASALGISIRLLKAKTDTDRVVELWANLAMIQEMQGNPIWLAESRKAKESWGTYAAKLIKNKKNRVFVFENKEAIFGFAFATLEDLKIQGKKHLKATLHELYLEPGFRTAKTNKSMATMLREALKSIGVEFIEFAVKDLA